MTITVGTPSSVASFSNGSASATASISLAGVNLNETIIVALFALDASGSPHFCSVNDGNAYTAAAQKNQTTIGSGQLQAEIHYLHAASAGTHTITVTNGAGAFNSYGYCVAVAVAGLTNAAPDATNTNSSAGSTNPTSGSATPTTTSSISVGVVALDDSSGSVAFGHPPSGYTSVGVATNASASFVGGSADRLILTTTGAENPSWATFTAGGAWAAAIAIFKEAVSADILMAQACM